MKKYIFLALASVLIGITACSKLDVAPRGEITNKKQVYQNDITRNQILAGIYAYLYNENTWGAFIPIRMEAATDVAISRSMAANSVENNSHTANALNDCWAILYQAINAANEFIHYSDLYASESDLRTQEICEARFLRAYFYFTLVRMFGDVPLRTQPMLDLNNTDIARTSAVDIYDFIVQELNEIQAIMPNPNEVGYGHVANTTAQTALADVYLNLNGYLMKDRLPADSTSVLMHQRAAYWCQKVLANPAHDITKTNYISVFMNQVKQLANLNEQIWELQTKYQRTDNGYNTDSRLGKYNGIGGDNNDAYSADAWIFQSSTLRPLYGKINAGDVDTDQRAIWNCTVYKMKGKGDTKHNAPDTVVVTTDPNNRFQFYPGKWRTVYANTATESASKSYSGARLSMYRIAEVHLMLAEALNEGYNDQTGAVDQINIVRRRAKATEITTIPSKDGVFELVVDERARELCFEGKRRFDLIRWGIYEKRIKDLKPDYFNAQNYDWVKDKLGTFNNFNSEVHYIMPIPQAEISRNRLIPQSEQNKGWGGNRTWK